MVPLALLVILGVAGTRAGAPSIAPVPSGAPYTYSCAANNTISVSGLPTNFPTMNYYAVQEADGAICNVTGDKDAGTAEISGCSKDQPIIFTFSSYIDMSTNQIHGGQDVDIVNITCYEISDAGEALTISNTLGASITLDDETAINVTYSVTSALNPTSANVGDSVTWTITYPMNYTLQVTSCTAYPGTDSSASNSIALIANWCSSETELIGDFSSNIEDTEATATIKAFKFHDDDNVFVTCELLVCPPTSNSCNSTCGARKRRSQEEKTYSGGEYKKSVGTVLHVIDTSAASSPYTGLFKTFVILYLTSIL